jgi:predicted anti-sigma-YlaC factor YlaD
MISSDEVRNHMVKEYVGNVKKFYDHLENCESCRKK